MLTALAAENPIDRLPDASGTIAIWFWLAYVGRDLRGAFLVRAPKASLITGPRAAVDERISENDCSG